MSVVLQSSGGGSVTLQEPATASNRTLTLPDVTGTVASQAYVDTAVAAVPVGGMTLLGTINTTSGSSQSLSGLTLTGYKQLYFVFNGVAMTSAGNVTLSLGSQAITGTLPAPSTVYGHAALDLAVGTFITVSTSAATVSFASNTPPSGSNFYAGRTSYTTASTSVAVGVIGTSPSFTAGTVTVYGVK